MNLVNYLALILICIYSPTLQIPLGARIDALVVLPDHLHVLWFLPPDAADFSIRWRLINTAFARHRAYVGINAESPRRPG
jgi:REP element-mobilizing transposase RayT